MEGEASSAVQAEPRPAPSAGIDAPDAVVERFAKAIAARDYVEIFSGLAPEARFRFLIPPGPGQKDGAAEVAAKFLEWFGDAN